MQNQASNTTAKRGGARPGAGRPVGRKGPAALKKIALKTLEQIMVDESASPEARAIASCKIIDQAQL